MRHFAYSKRIQAARIEHLELAALVDFARNRAPENAVAGIRAHLVGGCVECTRTVRFFKKLDAACHRVAAVSVPDHLERNARSILPQFPIRPDKARRVAAQLVFDSFETPALAGFRSDWQVGWQVLYRSADCSLDLRVEPEAHSSAAMMTGQISNHALPETRLADIPVHVKSGRLVVAEARSNEFGEFQLEYAQHGRLNLWVYLDGGTRYIQVPLRRLSTGSRSPKRDDEEPRTGEPER